MKTELDKGDSTKSSTVTKQSDNKSLKVTYKGYETTINVETGSMTVLAKVGTNSGNDTNGIDWEEKKRTATKHPNQSAENNDIGIDANGNAINLDLWNYHVEENKLYLGEYNDSNISSACYVPYSNPEAVNLDSVELENLVCPQQIKINGEWKEVVGLTDYAFYDCGNMKTLVLPSSLNSIGSSCFYDCTGLTELHIPNRNFNRS